MVGIRSIPLALLTLALLPASAAATPTTQIIVKREPGLSGAERADIRADADVRFVETLPLPSTEVVAAEPGDVVRRAARPQRRPRRRLRRARPRRSVPPRPMTRSCPISGRCENRADIEGEFVTEVADADTDAPEAWDAQHRRAVRPSPSSTPASTRPSRISRASVSAARTASSDDDDAEDRERPRHARDGHDRCDAATTSEGIVGVAPDAQVVPLRVLDDDGTGTSATYRRRSTGPATTASAIVNASLGGVGCRPGGARCDRSSTPTTLFVVAAGNGETRRADERPTTTRRAAVPVRLRARERPLRRRIDDTDDRPPASRTMGRRQRRRLRARRRHRLDLLARSRTRVSDGTSMATPHVAGGRRAARGAQRRA